eukprot:189087-Chlamydomonas_euryale.AAC.5
MQVACVGLPHANDIDLHARRLLDCSCAAILWVRDARPPHTLSATPHTFIARPPHSTWPAAGCGSAWLHAPHLPTPCAPVSPHIACHTSPHLTRPHFHTLCQAATYSSAWLREPHLPHIARHTSVHHSRPLPPTHHGRHQGTARRGCARSRVAGRAV